MPIRSRADMHLGLDFVLSTLNSTPSNRIDPPVKDYFLNMIISLFVTGEINKANKPDETKRVPFRIMTYGDILTKYNSLYTLIKVDDTLLPLTKIDNNFNQYTLPSDLFRFESSFANVRPLDCITYPSALVPTLELTDTAGNVNIGKHYYFVTFLYGTTETDINGENVANITTTDTNGNVSISNIPIGLSGCTGRKIYRTKLNDPWYKGKLVTTILNNTETTYTDTKTDVQLGADYSGNTHDTQLSNPLLDTYDIIPFNNNPYGGGGKYIGTIVDNIGLRLYHLNRYAISKVGAIYIKKPAVLTSSPSVINCDLPESIHDIIVNDTAKFIAAAVNNGSYQQLLMEAKSHNQ
jgi:hypothetical protein